MRKPFPILLTNDCCGSMVIETAILAPILLTLSLGTFEVGTMVARQSELQSAASEALAIAQAAPPLESPQRDTIRDVLKASTGLSSNDQVSVSETFRCGTDAAFVDSRDLCPSGSAISTYIQIVLTDRYEPQWTAFGLGEGVDLQVDRTVQIQ